jgi:hypothetical protein
VPKKELSEKERQTMYQRTFSTPEGIVVLDDLRDKYLRRSGLSPSNDPNAALACAAQRAVILEIEQMVEGLADGGTAAITESDESESRAEP